MYLKEHIYICVRLRWYNFGNYLTKKLNCLFYSCFISKHLKLFTKLQKVTKMKEKEIKVAFTYQNILNLFR